MADTVTNDLTAKVGPLPAWAWGAGIVGGFLFYRHNRQAANAAATAAAVADPNNVADPNAQPDPSASDATVTDLTGGSYGVPSQGYDPFAGLSGSSPGYNITPNNSLSTIPGPATDQQWSTLASNYLLSTGQDPSTIQNALSKYLSGLSLTSAEVSIVNAALRQFGSPPEGNIAVLTDPAVAPTPSPTPADTSGPTPAPAPAPTPSPAPAPAPTVLTPAAPTVVGQENASREVILTWNRPTGAVAFYIFYAGKLIKLQTGTKHTSSVYPKGYHYGPFTVKAVGITGKTSPLSNAVTVTIR